MSVTIEKIYFHLTVRLTARRSTLRVASKVGLKVLRGYLANGMSCSVLTYYPYFSHEAGGHGTRRAQLFLLTNRCRVNGVPNETLRTLRHVWTYG